MENSCHIATSWSTAASKKWKTFEVNIWQMLHQLSCVLPCQLSCWAMVYIIVFFLKILSPHVLRFKKLSSWLELALNRKAIPRASHHQSYQSKVWRRQIKGRICIAMVLHRKLTWNLKMMFLEKESHLPGVHFRFHVSFRGCNFWNCLGSKVIRVSLFQSRHLWMIITGHLWMIIILLVVFHQRIWKICSSKWVHLPPKFRADK